jgi:hypothetical protein
VLGERKTDMPKYLVVVAREVEVDCEGEDIARKAALRVVETGCSSIGCHSVNERGDYDAGVRGDASVMGVIRVIPSVSEVKHDKEK